MSYLAIFFISLHYLLCLSRIAIPAYKLYAAILSAPSLSTAYVHIEIQGTSVYLDVLYCLLTVFYVKHATENAATFPQYSHICPIVHTKLQFLHICKVMQQHNWEFSTLVFCTFRTSDSHILKKALTWYVYLCSNFCSYYAFTVVSIAVPPSS